MWAQFVTLVVSFDECQIVAPRFVGSTGFIDCHMFIATSLGFDVVQFWVFTNVVK